VLLLAFMILPPVALAAVTDGLMQFVLAALAVGGFFTADMLSLIGWRHGWGRVAWLQYAVMAAILLLGLTGLILFEYARRRTGAARAVLAAVVFIYWSSAMLPVPHTALALGTTPQTGIQLDFDSSRAPLGKGAFGLATTTNESAVEVMLPIRIEGLAPGMWPLSDGTQLTIDGRFYPWSAAGVAVTNGAYWAGFLVPEKVFDAVRHRPLRLWARVDLTLVSRTTTINLAPGTRAARVPGAGICSVHPNRIVECFAPFSSAFWSVAGFGVHTLDNLRILHGCCGVLPGFSVWAMSIGVDPLQTTPDVAIESYAPVAHFEREFEVPAIVLDSYEVARRRR
jgi:hypothetical protein